MTMIFASDVPPDILIEREVDKIIEAGCSLPRWGWPVPAPFNGATSEERIAGWQKLRVADRLGLLSRDDLCGLCGSRDAPQRHTEIYSRVFTSKAVCRSCHIHIHKRFKRPDLWAAKLADFPSAEDWVRALRTVELSRSEALKIARHADVFAAIAALA